MSNERNNTGNCVINKEGGKIMFDEYDPYYLSDIRKNLEIARIEDKIKDLKKQKKEFFKERRKFASTLRRILTLSTALCTGAGIGIGTIVGHSPLKKEDVTRKAHIRTEISSDREKEIQKQYEPFADEKSSIRYYSDWVQNGGKYYTCETTYDVTGLSVDEVEGFIKIKGFEQKPFGEPVEEKIIVKESVSEEEINNGPHYEGVIYEVDPNDTIVTPQTDYEQKEDVMYSLVAPTIGGALSSALFGYVINDDMIYYYYVDGVYNFNKRIIDNEEKLKRYKKTPDEEPVKKLKK